MTGAASRVVLLALARRAIAEQLGELARPATFDDPVLDEKRGAFVTLSRAGRLRGCIGRTEPRQPLRELIPEIARGAAFEDPRFPPVTLSELSALAIEISLLSAPERIDGVHAIEVGRHGIIVALGIRRGLLLPQVAASRGWTNQRFLEETCAKASLARQARRRAGVAVYRFEADVFSDGGTG